MRIILFALRSDLVETDHLGPLAPYLARLVLSLANRALTLSLSLVLAAAAATRCCSAPGMAGGSFSRSSSSVHVRPGAHSQSGRLPLVQCLLCQTLVVERTSQTTSSPGKKFFKCPKNENLPNHCKFFMWEDKYEAYLVDNGLFLFDIGIPDDAMTRVPAAVTPFMEVLLDELKVAVKEVQETMEEMKGSIVAIPPVLTTMRNTMNGMYSEMKGLRFGMAGNVVNKNRRLRERMMMLGWSIVFLLVAILVVSFKK